ncbi:hypothetical protein H0I25_11805 [Cellulophaga sp. HaHa_2_95]|uniref:hypothetical protein n=1 Tax=Cellulophaga sp. HaHa_2_95 TaxID=2745558 RepID=UPI001C4EC5D3|nr:hypothetical protein [Cellulophaga sp. HaHa_2_95]QXP54771.1 hypothetical protein H0I25_11805 [Cellulophaga sp. HaHa_2_95]
MSYNLIKYKLVFLVALLSLFSCAQQTKDLKATTALPTTIEHVNATNIVDYLASQVISYNKQPIYAIRPIQNNCIFVILVNGRPIYREFSLEKLATPLIINDRILKSGPQTITYRLYPIGDLMVQEYGTEESISTLRKNTSMKIEVIEYKDSKIGTTLSDEVIIANHTSPIDKNTDEFIGVGLPYYENTFTFEATVPYENEGWLEGQDLSKYDHEELEEIIKKKNLDIGKLYNDKNLDSLIKLEFVKSNTYNIANYRTKEDIQEIFDNYKNKILKIKDIQPLEGYQMEFYSEHKIVTLRYSIIAPPDPRLKGKPALYYLYDEGDLIMVDFLSLYFYLPKGKPLTVENLQIL